MKLHRLCVLACVLAAWSSSSAGAASDEPAPALLVGTARVDITPDEEVELAGYPREFPRRSGQAHDRLFARVVALQAGPQRLVFVTTDVIGFHGVQDLFVDAICESAGLPRAALFLTAIHTHSGPFLTLAPDERESPNHRYTLRLQRSLVRAVREALKAPRPARWGLATGCSTVGVNRRVLRFQPDAFPFDGGLVGLGRNPDGIADHEVQVLRLVSDGGEVCLFDYACHARSQEPGPHDLISGDFIGLAEQWVEKHLPEGATAGALVGASGDIDPIFFRPGFRTENGWVPETVLLSMMLGTEVVNLHRSINPATTTARLRSDLVTLALPARRQGQYVTDPGLPAVPLNITVAALDDLVFVGLGCEPVTAIGLEIKRASPFRHTFVITHGNGASGYLSTAEMFKERGYEVSSSPFGPEAAAMVTREVARLLHKLRAAD